MSNVLQQHLLQQPDRQQQEQQLLPPLQQWRHHQDTPPQSAADSLAEPLSLYRICRERIRGASLYALDGSNIADGPGVTVNAPSPLIASGPLISHSSRNPTGRQLLHMPFGSAPAAAVTAATPAQASVQAALPAGEGPAAEAAAGISARDEAAAARLGLGAERRSGDEVTEMDAGVVPHGEESGDASPVFQLQCMAAESGRVVEPSGELERWLQMRQESQQSQQGQERVRSQQRQRRKGRAGEEAEDGGEREEGVVGEDEGEGEEEGAEEGEGDEGGKRANKRRRERRQQWQQDDGRGGMDGAACEVCPSPEHLLHSHVQMFKSIRRRHQEEFIVRAKKSMKQLRAILVPAGGHTPLSSSLVLPSIDDSYIMRCLGITGQLI
ncbi:hypothetical protein CLOM_g3239 [Closterium sp. NIES-68]|nr:hypothetical protein CLOM_g3239 [Closterium sp. NIES-68]GJP68315.1 hypothetical protein CLOP_g25040 [Closterium sp. NIES-67]GJP76390.1 hypothetical protein CLOP_g6841 [Closterium sp. NIES-67]